MRSVFFFFAILLGVGLLLTVGRFLFAIWFVGALAGLAFFALRGIRYFLRQRANGYGGDDRSELLRHWRRSRELPLGRHSFDPLVSDNVRHLEPLTRERVIKVE